LGFNNFQFPTPNISPQTPHILNRGRWCYLANKLKPYCKPANCRNFHVWNSHRRHAARLFHADNNVRSAHSQQQLIFL